MNTVFYTLRDHVRGFFTQLSESIRWSSLATFGQSYAVRLTILVPFVGYLIIFNQHVQSFLALSIDAIGGMEASKAEPSFRLYYLYFGLLLLGIGSFLYTILAPTAIKQHPLMADYVHYMDSIATDNLARNSLDNLLRLFLRYNDDEQRSWMFSQRSFSFPDAISEPFHYFVEAFYTHSGWEEDAPNTLETLPDNEQFNVDDFYFDEVRTGSGYLLTDKVVERMSSNRKLDHGFVSSMYASALKNKNDIFVLEHSALDYSYFLGRFIVFLFYAAGFLVLFIPTVETTLALMAQWF